MVLSGGRPPSPEEDREADRQLLLRARNARVPAGSFHPDGIVPVIDDVVVRRAHLDFYLAHLDGLPLRPVVLEPTPETAGARIAVRDEKLVDDRSFLDRVLRDEPAGEGIRIDRTDLSLAETVDAILAGR